MIYYLQNKFNLNFCHFTLYFPMGQYLNYTEQLLNFTNNKFSDTETDNMIHSVAPNCNKFGA